MFKRMGVVAWGSWDQQDRPYPVHGVTKKSDSRSAWNGAPERVTDP